VTGQGQVQVSAREAEVLAAIGDHRSNAQIAHALHISVRTVESHVSSLLRKYGVADRRELADLVGGTPTPVPSGVRGVPAARTTFVGRETERQQVVEALAHARLVTLLGPGGMGKTRLAAVVAAAYPADGAFVDLVPVRDGLVARAVAAALDVTEQPPQPLDRALTERLRTGRTLLVLDNCEHLAEEVGEVAGRLLADCPGLVVLATSRERLGVPGEHTLALPPLTSEAERLFLDRARAVEPGFSADVSDLVDRLDGMPLAIELAAARVASLGIDGLRTGLDDRLRLLAGGRGADPRHRSLRAVIDWSHDLLDESERTLFRRLSVFAGGFDLDAAWATSPELSRGEVADLAGRLADKSLTVRRGTRWRMLETIRLYAAQQLGDGERAQLGPRYLRWAAATANQLESALDAGNPWRRPFDEVVSDLRAAVAGTPAEPDPVAHRIARSLAHLTFARRSLTEAGDHYLAAADRAEVPLTAAEDLRSAANVALAVSDGRAAVDHLLAAAAKAVADDNLRAGLLASAVICVNRYPAGALYDLPAERTADLLREAEHLADSEDPHVAALLVAAKAWDHGNRRTEVDPQLAVEAVTAARRSGDPVLIAGALDTVVIVAGGAGRLREAKGYAEERLELVEPLPRHEPYAAAEITDAFWVASTTAIATGDLPAALAIAERAAEDPATDHPYVALPRQIRVYALLGRFDEAITQADLLWERWHGAGEPPMEWMASAFAIAAAVHGLRRDGDFALWQQRARRSAGVDAPTLAASAAFADALVAVHAGPDDSAATLVERAFVPFTENWWEPYARAAGAELAVVAGLPDAEQRLARAAPAEAENDWAAACLTRASARLRGDRRGLEQAAERFARIGAEYERAQTEELLKRS
jgi:predicted ATPase/DNA-binding CsgD family transcriptional regulator